MTYIPDSRLAELIGSTNPDLIATARRAVEDIGYYSDTSATRIFMQMLMQEKTPTVPQNQPVTQPNSYNEATVANGQIKAPEGYEIDQGQARLFNEAVEVCRVRGWDSRKRSDFIEAVRVVERGR